MDPLNANEQQAVKLLKQQLLERFPSFSLVLYGSKARGDSDEDSDIDLLVLLECPVDNSIEEIIFHMAYDIELSHDVVFGIVVMNRGMWDTRGRYMPLRWNVDREGIAV